MAKIIKKECFSLKIFNKTFFFNLKKGIESFRDAPFYGRNELNIKLKESDEK